ncbi:hypothetical protein VCO01S_30760 [Vibrio comitans NBRC 102076]|uniref:Uncharacterized protein n=1 Tax=Vibrio comitans NBRC 102076 TaxID=1219078 RepID=A0A4Y3IQW9_9VIBR|nr:hypothetical protein VCO01S_30760 [Vibrio comitans NBRC 102076]
MYVVVTSITAISISVFTEQCSGSSVVEEDDEEPQPISDVVISVASKTFFMVGILYC